MTNETIDSTTILTWLQNRIAQELNCEADAVDLGQSFDLLGLDSVSLLWIAGELAEWLKIEITAALIFESTDLRQLSDRIFTLYEQSSQPG